MASEGVNSRTKILVEIIGLVAAVIGLVAVLIGNWDKIFTRSHKDTRVTLVDNKSQLEPSISQRAQSRAPASGSSEKESSQELSRPGEPATPSSPKTGYFPSPVVEAQQLPPASDPFPSPPISTLAGTAAALLRVHGDIGVPKGNNHWRIEVQNGAFAETPERFRQLIGSVVGLVNQNISSGGRLLLPEGHQALLLRLGLQSLRERQFDSSPLDSSNFVLVDRDYGDRLDPFFWMSVSTYGPPQAQWIGFVVPSQSRHYTFRISHRAAGAALEYQLEVTR